MWEQEYRKLQHSDPQKPDEQKPVTQPNVPVPPKQELPSGQPKTSAAGDRRIEGVKRMHAVARNCWNQSLSC